MSKKKSIINKTSILIIGFVLVVTIFFSFSNKDFKVIKNLDIFYSLFREINLFYVDEIDPEDLINSSIDGMLNSLDPYTTYIPESELDNFKFMTTGEYGGIGALIRTFQDYVIIAEPYESFPAAKAGIKAGDKIIEIDGKSIKDEKLKDVSELLKGAPHTKVNVIIERYGIEKPLSINITREKITINNVPYFGILNDSIGYIRLSNFTTNASDEVKKALINLKKKYNAKHIILDLRGNPGGLLIEAVKVASLFISKNQTIVSTKGKVQQWDKDYRTTSSPIDTLIPLIVLVNRASASASEIVAGSLQDLDRAVIIGQRTFGKGLVQTTRPLSYNAQLKVTTAKYYIPSGRCIQALDFTHRNEDGSVGHIPDSLISEFKTKNGRIVHDGGGIYPDIQINPEPLSKITLSLYQKNMIFDYATKYASTHDSIGQIDKFSISVNDFEDFINSINDKDFDYETESEERLKQLIETAQKEKYFAIAENEFNALENKLAHDKLKDLVTFKSEIIELINEEIISRYYYQKGRIRASIIDDNQVKKAIEVLSNIGDYYAILDDTSSLYNPSKDLSDQ